MAQIPSSEPDPRITQAAQQFADGRPALTAIEEMAMTLTGEFPDTPVKVIAAALANALEGKLSAEAAQLREVARALLIEAQLDASGSRHAAVRVRAGELMGLTRQGVERRFALAGTATQGSLGLTAAELARTITAQRG